MLRFLQSESDIVIDLTDTYVFMQWTAALKRYLPISKYVDSNIYRGNSLVINLTIEESPAIWVVLWVGHC